MIHRQKTVHILTISCLLALALTILAGCDTESAEERSSAASAGDPPQTEPWSQEQLLDPAELARTIEDADRQTPVILDIGGVGRFMGGRIQGSRLIGPTREAANLAKLRTVAAEYPKDVDLVVYCGCCPFQDCPNIRPAFRALQEMELTNLKLLDLPRNLRVNWVNHGYPVEE